jgi:hypothetical protein
MTEAAPANQIARLEYVIRAQMKEIDRLRDEVANLLDWIMGDKDALTCLQKVYNDSQTSEANRVKAAAAAIGFERPKMGTTNLVVVDFRERVRQARLKAPFAGPVIEHQPSDDPAA